MKTTGITKTMKTIQSATNSWGVSFQSHWKPREPRKARGESFETTPLSKLFRRADTQTPRHATAFLVTRPKYPPPPHRETGVAIPPSHCVSCGIADYRCYTPTSFPKNSLSQSKGRPNKGGTAEKHASEAYRATGGVA